MALQALDPIEVRFSEEGGDRERYGDRWYRYDEAALIRLPAREQIKLEREIGTTLVSVMNGVRISSTFGDLAAAWLAVRAADPLLAGSFDDFEPLIKLAEWRAAEDEDQGKAPEPEDTQKPPVTGYLEDHRLPRDVSAQMATVALPSLPIAE